MAYIIQDSTLTGIADAIRAKRETTEKIKVSNMKAEIEAIEGDKSGAIIDRSITRYSNDNIKKIGDLAFYNCTSLTSVDLPSATNIGSRAFDGCSALASVVFPSATDIGDYAFQNCGVLTSADFPNATFIRNGAFSNCSSLTSRVFPNTLYVDDYAFQNCNSLTSVVFPRVIDIGRSAFCYCNSLTSVDFSRATDIGTFAFGGCSMITNLILRGNKVCALEDESMFSGSKIGEGTGHIYVPKSILDSYKTATNWSKYAAQFRALEDYTVDGTTTGELDTTKI